MKKGFTLIELLIVIGILAVLGTLAVVMLDPAELVREARDAQRLSDLRVVKSAIDFFIVERNPADLNAAQPGTCTLGGSAFPAWRASIPNLTENQQPFVNPFVPVSGPVGSSNPAPPAIDQTPQNINAINGTGWVPINFNLLGAQTPFPRLPVDPLNKL